MRTLKVFDVFVVGMFVFGLAYTLSYRLSHQETPIANNNIEATLQKD